MIAPVAVFAIGNRSRGDDALAPLLLERLRAWLEAEDLADSVDLFEEYQLQVENALDLEGRRLALFIDASIDAQGAVAFGPVVPCGALSAHASHALAPGAVLRVYEQVTGEAPPPAFLLGVHATGFELGAGLSGDAEAALEEAWDLLHSLLQRPLHAQWLARAAVACHPVSGLA